MLLLRHGQSEFNALFGPTRVDPGIEDPGLTDLGRWQASQAAEALAAAGIRRLIVSPYRRTLETARLVASRLAAPITVEPLIREQFHFVCDIGTPTSRLAASWPELCFDGMAEQWWPGRSEPEGDVVTRGRAFLDRWHPVERLADACLVTHWGFIRALTGERVANGALVRFLEPGAGEVVHAGYP